jgi:amidohydrolase
MDAIIAASHVICALQTVVSRTIDPTDSAVVTVGTIAGGYQRNIIADKVEFTGTIRTLNPETREKTQASLKKIIEGVAESFGTKGTVKFTPSCPYLVNHNAMSDLVKTAAEDLLGKEEVTLLPKPTMGVEDFACFVQRVPGAYYRIGIKNDAKGFNQPGHSSLYDLDEAALPVAAAMHAKIALAYLAVPKYRT